MTDHDREIACAHIARRFVQGEPLSALGDDAEAMLREAVMALGAQGYAAARLYDRALRESCAMVELLDSECGRAGEEWSADEWQYGRTCGRAELAAQASHMIGHAVNSWKLEEVGG